MVNLKKGFDKLDKTEELLINQHLDFDGCAWESGFYKRSPKKIMAIALFFSLWRMQRLGKNSLRKWSIELSKICQTPVSKQSLNERLNEDSTELAKLLLKNALNINLNKPKIKHRKSRLEKCKEIFNRVFVRDSSVQTLPSHLSNLFKGSYSHGKPTAMMRIQALFDYTHQKWIDFSVHSYTDNDQGAAFCIKDFLEPGDLLLQDLGYFTLDWLEHLLVNQFVITKWDNRSHLLTLEREKIDLLKLVKGKREVDCWVLVGKEKQLKMRLVIRKLPKAKIKKRIKAAQNDRHSNANHSEEYFELLKYEIYLTNVPKEKLNSKDIAKLYGLRWHIEILFKSWKSYANFKKLFKKEKMQEHRVKFTIYALLIEFAYMMSTVYHFTEKNIKKQTNRKISILKFTEEVVDSITTILFLKSLDELLPLMPIYAKNITYEKRSDRKNTIEKYLYVKDL